MKKESYLNMLQSPVIYVRENFFSSIIRRLCAAFSNSYGDIAERESFFLQIVELHSDLISRICRSFASKDSDFDDLRQDALLNIWRGVSSFRNESNIKTWIYRVTLNTCVSTYRRNSGKGEKVDIEVLQTLSDPERSMWEESQWLEQMVSQLHAEDHAIIMMWLDDLTYDEIAEVMGMNRNTIATRVRRIKQHLKDIYDKRI